MEIRLCGLIVRVRVVPRRTVVGDIDRRFDNLSGSHHQSHVNCVSSVYGIYIVETNERIMVNEEESVKSEFIIKERSNPFTS